MVSELVNSNVHSNNVSIVASLDQNRFTINDSNVDLYRQSMEAGMDAEAKAYASMMAKRKLEREDFAKNHIQATNYGEAILPTPTPSVGVVGLNNTKRKVGIV